MLIKNNKQIAKMARLPLILFGLLAVFGIEGKIYISRVFTKR